MKPGINFTLANVVLWTDNRSLKSGTAACMGAGPFTGTPTINAPATNRAFHVVATHSLVVTDVNIAGGAPAAGNDGGTVFVGGGASLAVFGGTISGGTVSTEGGCLYGAAGSTVILDGVTVSGCNATNGGGIALDTGSLGLFYDVTISGNAALLEGGGLWANGADVSVTLASSITGNDANNGGGIAIRSTGANALLDLTDDTVVDLNTASSGGGIDLVSGEFTIDVDITDRVVIDSNSAHDGGGIAADSPGDLVIVQIEDQAVLSNNDATDGGAINAVGSFVYLYDDVAVLDNVGSINGGGMWLKDATVGIYGSSMDALGTLGATTGGVRFERNSTPYDSSAAVGLTRGSAIFAWDSTVIDADQMAVEGHDGMVVSLRSGATMGANRSHFNKNNLNLPAVPTVVLLDVADTASLEIAAEFGDAGCTDALDPFSFSADRYCSEISFNRGMLMNLDPGGIALVRTTAIMDNVVKSTQVGFDVMGDLTFTTNMVGHNGQEDFPSVLVAVRGGGDFQAKQNTFADFNLPVSYEAGSTGDFRRNAAFDAGFAGVAVVVDPAAVVTGTQNIGDWSGIISSAFPNGTAPGWVTTARGDFHLAATSTAVDICTIDGPFDVEGTPRPVPVGLWDAGAIEFTP